MFRLLECTSIKSIKGGRKYMEDAYRIAKTHSIIFFGIYDGHGGGQISEKLSLNLHLRIFETLEVRLSKISPIKGLSNKDLYDISKLIQRTFIMYDGELFESRLRYVDPGSTATLVIQIFDYIFLVNTGDSRSIHIRNGKVIQSTIDHKPTTQDENDRIKKAGGFVWNNRIWGRLAVSRGFGDFDYGKTNLPPSYVDKISSTLKIFGVDISEQKNPEYLNENWVVSPIPDVFAFSMDEFTTGSVIILASDGFWDVFSNEELAQLFSTKKRNAEELVKLAYNKGSKDNITVMLVG